MDYRPKTTTSYATQRGRDSGAEPQLLVPHSSAGFLCAHCPCHPGEHCVYPPPASLCISLPDHSQELLHHQAGLRSQNLYPEKAEVILGPAESAMGTSSIYTAHVQRTPWPPPPPQLRHRARGLEPTAGQICPSTLPSPCFLGEAHAALCPLCVLQGSGDGGGQGARLGANSWMEQLALGSLATANC